MSEAQFSPEQLAKWFGENWRDLFSKAWQQLLEEAEFGDAVAYRYITADVPLLALFVLSDEGLVGWDIREGSQLGEVIQVQDLARKSIEGTMALYRSVKANKAGGASDWPEGPPLPEWGFLRYQRVSGPYTAPPFIELPSNWYIGSTCHVEAFHHVAGIDPGFSDIVGLAEDAGLVIAAAWAARHLGIKTMATKAGAAFGGLGAAVGLAVDIWDWLTWDTSFYVAAGPGAPWPPPPIPTPPATPSAP